MPDDPVPPPHIGTLNEAPLHAALKALYSVPGSRQEVRIGRYVIDVVQPDGLLVEIQTRSLGKMKRKLTALLGAGHTIRVVHPVAREKWIVKLPTEPGGRATRRKSPKRGTMADVFAELVSFPTLLLHPGLSLEVVLIQEEELRRHDPGKAWRRRGWVVDRRRLLEVVERRTFRSPADLATLLPDDLPPQFTSTDLKRQMGITPRLAGQICYCLRETGAITQVGKQGRAYLYENRPAD